MKNILNCLKTNNRLQTAALLILSSLLSLSLLLCRMLLSFSLTYGFLVWNLFLAMIPYLISTWIIVKQERIRKPHIIAVLTFLWLLFFPNAPYILTDLLHLRERQNIPLWYDLLLLLSFGWNGL